MGPLQMPAISGCRCRHKGCRGLRKSEVSNNVRNNARRRRMLLGARCDCGRSGEKQHTMRTMRTILSLPPLLRLSPPPPSSTNCRLWHHACFLPVDEGQGGTTRDELLGMYFSASISWRPRTHALRANVFRPSAIRRCNSRSSPHFRFWTPKTTVWITDTSFRTYENVSPGETFNVHSHVRRNP